MSIETFGTKFVPHPGTIFDGRWFTYGRTGTGEVVFYITDYNPGESLHGLQRLQRTTSSLEEGEAFYEGVITLRDLKNEPVV